MGVHEPQVIATVHDGVKSAHRALESRHRQCRTSSHPPSFVKEPSRLGPEHLELVARVGDVEHKVQRPTQQLGQCGLAGVFELISCMA